MEERTESWLTGNPILLKMILTSATFHLLDVGILNPTGSIAS
jgi:hypothetical protein